LPQKCENGALASLDAEATDAVILYGRRLL